MNDAIWIAAIVAVPPTLTALASLIVSLRNGRVIGKKVDEIKESTDGMKDELVRVTRSDATQKGHAAGVTDEKAAAAAKGRKR